MAAKESSPALMKRSVSLVAAVLLAGALAGAVAAPAGASRSTQTTYYVSVGDSLAAGFQPRPPFSNGYADQLYAIERAENPGLALVKLGCGGENTDTLIHGGICTYPKGSQLDQAVAFLEAHPGQIAFVTIDIGGNDALACWDFGRGRWHLGCLREVLPTMDANLATILDALRDAAGPDVPILGMTYYDPFLGFWVLIPGQDGRSLAKRSEVGFELLNSTLGATYGDADVPVADVAGAFDIANFANTVHVPGLGLVPVNVANACEWTWWCVVHPPRTPDLHANTAGYGVIAEAFADLLSGN